MVTIIDLSENINVNRIANQACFQLYSVNQCFRRHC